MRRKQCIFYNYAETPWYETSEGKLAIGIGVLVVTATVGGNNRRRCSQDLGRVCNNIICFAVSF